MRHCCEAIAICPTSLEMRPCMCTGRRVSARFGLDALIVVLRHPWSLLCTVLLTRLERHCIQHRSPSQPCRLLQRPCTTRARTLTPQRGGSLPGLEARRALHRASKHATDPRAAGHGPCLTHPCGAGCAHTIVLLASQPEESWMESLKNCPIRLCRGEGRNS